MHTLIFYRAVMEKILFIFAVGIFMAYTVIFPTLQRGDFAVFYYAGSTITGRFDLHPTDFYNYPKRVNILSHLVKHVGGTQFLYPPQSSLFFAPLTLAPYSIAKRIWDVLNACAILGAWIITIHVLLRDRFTRLRYSAILALLPFSTVVHGSFFSGQINGVILFLMVASLAFLLQKRDTWSGAMIGIAATIKVFPLFFLVHFIMRRRWRAIGTMLGTMLLFFSIALPIFGWHTMTSRGMQIQSEIVREGVGYLHESTSLFGLFRASVRAGAFDRIAPQTTHPRKAVVQIAELVHRWATLIVFAFLIFTLWRFRKNQKPHDILLDYAMLMLFILLFSKSTHAAFHLFILPVILFFLHFPLQRKYIMMHGVGIGVLLLTHFANIIPLVSPLSEGKRFATVGLLILFICIILMRHRPTALLLNDRSS